MGAAGETMLVDSANELTLSLPEERMMQVEDGLSPEEDKKTDEWAPAGTENDASSCWPFPNRYLTRPLKEAPWGMFAGVAGMEEQQSVTAEYASSSRTAVVAARLWWRQMRLDCPLCPMPPIWMVAIAYIWHPPCHARSSDATLEVYGQQDANCLSVERRAHDCTAVEVLAGSDRSGSLQQWQTKFAACQWCVAGGRPPLRVELCPLRGSSELEAEA